MSKQLSSTMQRALDIANRDGMVQAGAGSHAGKVENVGANTINALIKRGLLERCYGSDGQTAGRLTNCEHCGQPISDADRAEFVANGGSGNPSHCTDCAEVLAQNRRLQDYPTCLECGCRLREANTSQVDGRMCRDCAIAAGEREPEVAEPAFTGFAKLAEQQALKAPVGRLFYSGRCDDTMHAPPASTVDPECPTCGSEREPMLYCGFDEGPKANRFAHLPGPDTSGTLTQVELAQAERAVRELDGRCEVVPCETVARTTARKQRNKRKARQRKFRQQRRRRSHS